MGLEFDFSKVQEKLDEIGRKASKEVTDKALEAGANEVLEELKKEVYEHVRDDGDLYNSLGIGEITGSGMNKKISIGSQSDNKDIIARNFYQEYGNTYMLGKKHNKRAFDNSKKRANEAIKQSLKEDLL